MASPGTLGILVGGGPAPGINSVISAATIEAQSRGFRVLGIQDGFRWLMRGDTDHVRELAYDEVSRIHLTGGSALGTARDNPTKDPAAMAQVVATLGKLGVTHLITIGGDDTAFSAMKLAQLADDRIHVVHVPKTIDNDLDLPLGINTFGFQTARHLGCDIVKNLMVDGRTTSRWYFVVTMGRKAGHLAMGIGKSAGATLTLIPEEFREQKLRMSVLVDILVGSIIKRLSYGRPDGVVILAEGLVEILDPQDLQALLNIERDAHDNIRLAEVNFGEILKYEVQARLKQFNIKSTIVAKNIGYELRCADPIPFDMEYTRDLGYCAARYILEGGNAAMVSIQNGRFVPIPFQDILDPKTGRARIRMVDMSAEYYHIARRYMIRLSAEDFEDPHELAKYAATAGISLEEFRKQFQYLVDIERANGAELPLPLPTEKNGEAVLTTMAQE